MRRLMLFVPLPKHCRHGRKSNRPLGQSRWRPRQDHYRDLDSYETVDGIKFEKELHRLAGDPNRGSVIRFTKTVINQSVETSLFSLGGS